MVRVEELDKWKRYNVRFWYLKCIMNKYHIYCDESGIVNERYMVLGGIIFPSFLYTKHYAELQLIKTNHNKINHEIKFEKLRSHDNFCLYRKIIDYFIDEKIEFRSMIVDNTSINHAKYNSNQLHKKHQNEQGIHKLYYTLLQNCFFKTNANATFSCFLDDIPKTRSEGLSIIERPDINIIKQCLNSASNFNPCKVLEWVDSKESIFTQIADLLCGIAMFEKNEKYSIEGKSNEYKVNIMNYIKQRMNKQTLTQTTPYYELKWKVWNKQ